MCWEIVKCFLPPAGHEQSNPASPISASSPIFHAAHRFVVRSMYNQHMSCPWFSLSVFCMGSKKHEPAVCRFSYAGESTLFD